MRIIFVLLVFVFNMICYGQDFEGIITYTDEFNGYQKNYANRVDSITFYIKGNMVKFKSVTLPEYRYTLIKNGRCYYISTINNSITEDISYDPTRSFYDELLIPNESSNKEKITNFYCEKYQGLRNLNGMEEKTDLFISDTLITQVNFSYLFIKNIGIVIKLIQEFDFGIRITLIDKITPIKIDDSFFDLPDFPIVKKDMANFSKVYLNSKKDIK
jgi:hypothetical protein